MDLEEELEKRPKLKFEDLKVGMTLFQPDYHSESGVEEFTVKSIILYKTVEDPKSCQEYSEEVFSVEDMDHFSIGLDKEWTTSPYEKFTDINECRAYTLSELNRVIAENESMISRWNDTLSTYKLIRANIELSLQRAKC
jgi:hypothetical protein